MLWKDEFRDYVSCHLGHQLQDVWVVELRPSFVDEGRLQLQSVDDARRALENDWDKFEERFGLEPPSESQLIMCKSPFCELQVLPFPGVVPGCHGPRRHTEVQGCACQT